MDPFESLLEAIEQFSAAAAEYKTAAEKVRFDRGYFLHTEIEARDRAKKQLREALDSYIRQIIAAKEVG